MVSPRTLTLGSSGSPELTPGTPPQGPTPLIETPVASDIHKSFPGQCNPEAGAWRGASPWTLAPSCHPRTSLQGPVILSCPSPIPSIPPVIHSRLTPPPQTSFNPFLLCHPRDFPRGLPEDTLGGLSYPSCWGGSRHSPQSPRSTLPPSSSDTQAPAGGKTLCLYAIQPGEYQDPWTHPPSVSTELG